MLLCAVGWDDFSSRSIHFFIYLFWWEFAAKPFLRHLFSVSGELILSMSNSHDLCMKKNIVTVISYTKTSKGEDAFLLFAIPESSSWNNLLSSLILHANKDCFIHANKGSLKASKLIFMWKCCKLNTIASDIQLALIIFNATAYVDFSFGPFYTVLILQ